MNGIKRLLTQMLGQEVVESDTNESYVAVETNPVDTWEVRWTSRYGEYSSDTQPEIAVFTSEEEAEQFKENLRNAFKLIRHKHGNKVTINKKS